MSFLDSILSNEYGRFVIIFIGSIVALTIAYIVLKVIVRKIAGRKKQYGEYILKQLTKPLLILIFFIGLYSASESLTILQPYDQWRDAIFFIISIFILAHLATRILSVLMLGWLKVKKGFKRTPGLLNKAVSIIIFIIAIVIILGYLQIDITPMVAGVGIGALAIGLALQSTLSNFFAGMHLLSDRPINVGDFIELDKDTSGTVEDVGWRSTRIRTLADNLLIIPNAKLADSNITNFSLPKQEMSIWIPCGVAYESDLIKVEKMTLEVATQIQQTTEGAVKDFEPAFRYREFGDSNINFIAVLRVSEPLKRFVVRNEFIKALKERFDKEGIEISWPIMKIYRRE
jgi:small-conductance mechanosensitive channel